MGSGEGESVMSRLQRATTQQISLITLTVIMGVTGIAFILWMAAMHWADFTGIMVGVIFIVLTILQILFAIVWLRSSHKQNQTYVIKGEEKVLETYKAELLATHPPSNGPANGKVQHNTSGSGDISTEGAANSEQVLVTGEVKLSYTDGAQKIDAEVVKV